MLVFPNCKINIGLIVKGKRDDGYHTIETVFYPVKLNDALEIISSSETAFVQSGIAIDIDQNDNLCARAYRLLKKDFQQLPSVKIHLHKAIPIGAGLGGGSADATFTLIALDEKFALNLSSEQLHTYALQLGSDCPFFIYNAPCLATGRGETLQPLDISLKGYRLVLVNPRIHINTGWAFSALVKTMNQPSGGADNSLRSIISQPIATWKDRLFNDFEEPVFEKYPVIRDLKSALYDKGALFASMSGSGSSVYGIFNNAVDPSFKFPANYLMRSILL
ncbi:MAG: 4-diphosphocytidyl-2C-methyl-D-erythritol kinase [Ferruginibacter sp.]|nr:4-diphosphocytidyl-2C-methyl-D-erythritol kinase [Ferruginibacter sp.]